MHKSIRNGNRYCPNFAECKFVRISQKKTLRKNHADPLARFNRKKKKCFGFVTFQDLLFSKTNSRKDSRNKCHKSDFIFLKCSNYLHHSKVI